MQGTDRKIQGGVSKELLCNVVGVAFAVGPKLWHACGHAFYNNLYLWHKLELQIVSGHNAARQHIQSHCVILKSVDQYDAASGFFHG